MRDCAQETLLACQKKLRCHGCGVAVKAHINIWAKHVKSDACIKTRASLANRYNGVFESSSSLSLTANQQSVIPKLASAILVASGVSFNLQSELFCRGSPVIQALHQLTEAGLGSPNTIKENVLNTVPIIDVERIQPLLREVLRLCVPLAILVDDSTTKMAGKRSVTQMWLFSPIIQEPVPFDVATLGASPSAETIASTIKSSFTRASFMTKDQFSRHVAIVCSDHASSMLSAIKKLGVTAAGDAPHAI